MERKREDEVDRLMKWQCHYPGWPGSIPMNLPGIHTIPWWYHLLGTQDVIQNMTVEEVCGEEKELVIQGIGG